LNQGRASIQRLPDETDEEYAIRLRETGNAPEIDPAVLAERADLRNTQKLIINLKTILKPEQASNISKMLTADQKYEINKKFPKIKTAYEKTYSKTAKIPEQELIDFFMSELGNKIEEAPYTRPPAQRRPRPPRETADIAAARELTRQYREAEGELPVAQGQLIAPKASSLTMPQMREYLASNYPNDPNIKEAFKTSTSRARLEQIYKEAVGEVEPRQARLEFPLAKGEGIKSKALPKLAHFGKVSINPHKLYHKNILSVRNLKGQSIGVSDITVSDGMSEMLLKMLEGVNPIKKDFAVLDKHEPALYNNLIHLAQLHKNYETPNLQETKQQMKHRMELLQGELEAGNNAPSILSEAKQLLRLMVGNGMLKSTQARKHYEYLKSCC
jgi:hypothetical protein